MNITAKIFISLDRKSNFNVKNALIANFQVFHALPYSIFKDKFNKR